MAIAAGADQPTTQVRNAAAFGWALTELLGRAYALTEEPLSEHIAWTQPGLTLLPTAEGRPPREGLRAVMTQVSFLADQLGVSAQVIPQLFSSPRPDPSSNPSYVAVLTDTVTQLSRTADAQEVGQLQRSINERLFFWDPHSACPVAAVWLFRVRRASGFHTA